MQATCALPYPYNLFNDLETPDNFNNKSIEHRVCSPHAVLRAVSSLPDVQRVIIERRYKDNKTLAEIGKEQGKSKERIRQLEFKALFKLRHSPLYNEMWCVPIQQVVELKQKILDYEKLLNESKIKVSNVELYSSKPIRDLGLSIRTYNCLTRKNLQYVNDLLKLKWIEFLSIRGFGPKCQNELKSKMEMLGYVIGDSKNSRFQRSYEL